MITIIAKNLYIATSLCTALKEFNATIYEKDAPLSPILLVYDTQENVDILLKKPQQSTVILLGTHHQNADISLNIPCDIHLLKRHIATHLAHYENAPTFQNKTFLFDGKARKLTHIKSKLDIYLTQKETELIIALIKNMPNATSKADLLADVWQYHPDIESHTVETHIYALRQKIDSENTDIFIQNTNDGYILAK